MKKFSQKVLNYPSLFLPWLFTFLSYCPLHLIISPSINCTFSHNLLCCMLIDEYRHLTQLTRRGGNPFNFKFVEHHKVSFLLFSDFPSSWSHMDHSLKPFSICRPLLLHLLLLARRVYGIWMVRYFGRTNSRPKCSAALFPCLHLVLKFDGIHTSVCLKLFCYMPLTGFHDEYIL